MSFNFIFSSLSRERFLLLLMLALSIAPAWSQHLFRGVVKDSLANEPIPYASIYIEGSTDGTVGSVDGKFTINSPQENLVVKVQVLGYKTKEINLNSSNDFTTIYLQNTSRSLDEIVIIKHREKYEKKGNPAIAFINRVRAHMSKSDPLAKPFYSFNKYEEITYGLNDLGQFDKNAITKMFKGADRYLDTSRVTHKVILPVSLNETFSTEYYRNSPRSHKSHILGQRHVGLDESFDYASIKTFMNDAFREVDIFKNDVALMQNRFVSPLSSLGTSFYKYYLNDTIVVDGEPCIEVDFLPFNSESFGFVGRMYFPIRDKSMFMKKIVMNVPRAINLNYVERIFIEQQFKKSPNGMRLKTLDDMIVEFKVIKGTQGLFAHRKTLCSGFNFNTPQDLQIFSNAGETIVEAHANRHDDAYWAQKRIMGDSSTTQHVARLVKDLRSSKVFRTIEKGALLLYTGYVPTRKPSKFDLGPLNTLVSGNELEGLRLRVGGMSTAHLSNHWFGRGYLAYGFGDKKMKYHGEWEYSFNNKAYHSREFPIHSIMLSHDYDIDRVGQRYLFTNPDNVFLFLKRQKDNKINYLRNTRLTYKLELHNGFSLKAQLEHQRHEASRLLPFIDGTGRVFHHYSTAGVVATLRYAPGEKFYQTRSNRFPVNIDNPIITLTQSFKPKGVLGSDFAVNQTELSVQKRFWFSAWGYLDAIIKGAKIWSRVPYPDLLIPNANLSYTIQPESFSLMNAMEFACDQSVTWDFTYFMNGAIFNYIPLVKKLKLREAISFRGLWGALSDKNSPGKNAELFEFPCVTGCEAMGKRPYMEVGVGLDNILSILRVDYVWRLSYRDKPNIDKSGVRVQLHFTF